jgi:hypothetical protein
VIESIIAEIDVEISRLKQVRALLANDSPKRGRPVQILSGSPGPPPSRKKRVLTPEAKERIRQGQVRRWAAAKKAAKKSSKVTPQR